MALGPGRPSTSSFNSLRGKPGYSGLTRTAVPYGNKSKHQETTCGWNR